MAHTKGAIDQGIIDAMQNAIAAENAGAEQFVGAFNELRRRIVLSMMEGGSLSVSTAQGIKAQMKDLVNTFQDKIAGVLSDNQRRLFVKGIGVVDAAIKGANIQKAVPYLGEHLLDKAKVFGAELVTNLSDDLKSKIAQQIDLAVMGQKPLEETLKAIGTNLTDPSIFATITKRAEVIYRTEVNRMQNLAAEARIAQAQKQIPDMKKRWLHSHVGIPRRGHLRLDGTTIAADEQFTLLGEDGISYTIDGPHDPMLPAGEVINCKCNVIPVVGRFDKAEQAVAQDMAPPPEENALPIPDASGTEAPNPAPILPKPPTAPGRPKLEPAQQVYVDQGLENLKQYETTPGQIATPIANGMIPDKIWNAWANLGHDQQLALVNTAAVVQKAIGNMVTVQKTMPAKTIAGFIKQEFKVKPHAQTLEGYTKDLPVALKGPDGKYYLIDGAKRIAAKALMGFSATMIREIQLPPEPPPAPAVKAKPMPPDLAMKKAQQAKIQKLIAEKLGKPDPFTPEFWDKTKPQGTATEQALQKAQDLKPLGLAHYVTSPLTQAEQPAAVKSFLNKTTQAAWKEAPVQAIDLSKIRTDQPGLNPKKLQAFIKDPNLIKPGTTTAGGFPEDTPLVVSYKGEKYIYDGNHRVAAEKLLGNKTMLARVIEIPGGATQPAAQPVKEIPIPKLVDVTNTAEWKKVGEQAGSNPGGVYQNIKTGEKFYVKTSNDPGQIQEEILANKLYRLAGVKVADITEGKWTNGRSAIASRIVEKSVKGAKDLTALKGALDGFAVDAWLGNWDVVGLENDNLVESAGKALRLDTGASLRFRASGKMKILPTDRVDEIATLRDPGKNAQSAAVFGKMTTREIMTSMQKVMDVDPQKIYDALAEGKLSDEAYRDLRKIVLGRREAIGKMLEEWKAKVKAGTMALDKPPEFNPDLEKPGAPGRKFHNGPWVDPIPDKAGRAPLPKDDYIPTEEDLPKTHTTSIGISSEPAAQGPWEKAKAALKGMLNETRREEDGHTSPGALKILREGLKFTWPEWASIRAYSGGWFTQVNGVLQSEQKVGKAWRIAEELMNRALEKVKSYDGLAYRSDTMYDNLKALREGDTMQVPGFWSSSRKASQIRDVGEGQVGFIIKHKNGKAIEEISQHPSETEILFMSRTRFRVLKIHRGSGEFGGYAKSTFIYLEEI